MFDIVNIPELPTSTESKHVHPEEEQPSVIDTKAPLSASATSIRFLKKTPNLNLNEMKDKKLKMDNMISAISQRLTVRKLIQKQLSLISDIMCALGILGIILMITANELTFNRQDNRDSVASWFIKLTISASTAILLALIIYYHLLNLKLYCAQNALHDWRVGLTGERMFLILCELMVCAVHPMPRVYPTTDALPIIGDKPPVEYTSVDVALGFPMFLRLYLVGRTILFHSQLVREASLQSLGYLNHVAIDFFFLMKTFLEQHPFRSLCIFQILAFLIGSWCVRACNYVADGNHFSIGDSMWLYIVTFFTIGYGDLVPSSTCGRAIAGLVGSVGIFSSSLLIAVVAQKLILRREEKYVHTFVLNIELAKARKVHAANVIKYAILAWYSVRKGRATTHKYFINQRRLFSEISNLQQVKQAQRGLIDNCIGLHELIAIQRTTEKHVRDTSSRISLLQTRIIQVEQHIAQYNKTLETLDKRTMDSMEKSSLL